MPGLVAFVVCLGLTPLVAAAGRRLEIVDRPEPGGLTIHELPTPSTGGVAVIVAWLVASVPLAVAQDGWLFVCVGVGFGAGFVDDLREGIAPRSRILALLGAGVAAALWVLGSPDVGGDAIVPVLVTVALLVVATANGVNLMDGADGLAAGTCAAAAAGLALVADRAGLDGPAWFALAAAGSALAFLVWNRPPARVFLGNGGAYGLGVTLGALVGPIIVAGGVRGVAASASCLGLFAFEASTTTIRRIASERPVGVGDRRHTYDLIAMRRGRIFSTRASWIAGIVLAMCGTAIMSAPAPVALALTVSIVCGFGLLAVWTFHSSQVHPT